jgi:fido (protein-threonine AMPylation protein)
MRAELHVALLRRGEQQKVNAGLLVRTAHREWYRELFQLCVAAGLIAPAALAGYRNDAVYFRTSRYVPPRWEVVREAMPGLFDFLEKEPEAAVRAVLGHWLFGYIHPYPDGNGRMARVLMNTMLASGRYPYPRQPRAVGGLRTQSRTSRTSPNSIATGPISPEGCNGSVAR